MSIGRVVPCTSEWPRFPNAAVLSARIKDATQDVSRLQRTVQSFNDHNVDLLEAAPIFFISGPDLIASKLAAGRMRDLANVEEIREAGPRSDPQN